MTTASTNARGGPGVMLEAVLRPAFAPPPPDHPCPTLVRHIVVWLARQHQRAALAGLDDQQLADIGVTRAEAIRESRRWT